MKKIILTFLFAIIGVSFFAFGPNAIAQSGLSPLCAALPPAERANVPECRPRPAPKAKTPKAQPPKAKKAPTPKPKVVVAAPAVHYVVDQRGEGDATGIQEAIIKAPVGAIIDVNAGTYDGPVVIDKTVTIVGHGNPTISSSASSSSFSTVTISGDNRASIEGVTIVGNRSANGLKIEGGNPTITNTTIKLNGEFRTTTNLRLGLWHIGGSPTFSDLTIDGGGIALFTDAGAARFENVTILNARYGVAIGGNSSAKFNGVNIQDIERTAMGTGGNASPVIENVTITKSGRGRTMGNNPWPALRLIENSNPEISALTVSDFQGIGVSVENNARGRLRYIRVIGAPGNGGAYAISVRRDARPTIADTTVQNWGANTKYCEIPLACVGVSINSAVPSR
ncbi:MAG: hypothetical protein FD163_761 [Hyphomonadaceae bacterium]|nr:MAG: hypothetical protein FD163_761 [Hyphomonadaceae bacterium]